MCKLYKITAILWFMKTHQSKLVILGESIALWGEPNELSIQHHVLQCVDSYLAIE